jgi:transcriptional regulator with XRE-family HTH domain
MLSPIKSNLSEKLKDKGYRTRFFRGRAQDEIAYQLRAARKKRRLTQPRMEQLSGMKQSAISRMEQASYSRWNFTSLLRLADALDHRVKITLEPAEDVIAQYAQEETRELTNTPPTVYVRGSLPEVPGAILEQGQTGRHSEYLQP